MIILIITFISGVITGILFYRNNINKLSKTEKATKILYDAMKGRDE